MDADQRVFVVGEYRSGYFGQVVWVLKGVFLDEATARENCRGEMEFIGRAPLGQLFEPREMPLWFPNTDVFPIEWSPEDRARIRKSLVCSRSRHAPECSVEFEHRNRSHEDYAASILPS